MQQSYCTALLTCCVCCSVYAFKQDCAGCVTGHTQSLADSVLADAAHARLLQHAAAQLDASVTQAGALKSQLDTRTEQMEEQRAAMQVCALHSTVREILGACVSPPSILHICLLVRLSASLFVCLSV